jgi:hypothetical protein
MYCVTTIRSITLVGIRVMVLVCSQTAGLEYELKRLVESMPVSIGTAPLR